MNGDRYDKAAQASLQRERASLEKKILEDLKDMMAEAYCTMVESRLLPNFKEELKGKIPTKSQVSKLKSEIEDAILLKNPKFEQFFDLIVERDRRNPVTLEVGIEVKPDLF